MDDDRAVIVETVSVTADALRVVVAFREHLELPRLARNVTSLRGATIQDFFKRLGETEESAPDIRKEKRDGPSLKELAGEDGIPWATIEEVVRTGDWMRVTVKLAYEAHKQFTGIDARCLLGDDADPKAVARTLQEISEAIVADEKRLKESEERRSKAFEEIIGAAKKKKGWLRR